MSYAALSALGQLAASFPTAEHFAWTYEAYYYVYTWTPAADWDAGRWVVGRELCFSPALQAPDSAWHVIFDAEGKLVLVDRHAPTLKACCDLFRATAGMGLGYNLTVGTPIGNQTFSIPLEKLAQDGGTMAIAAAWPPLQAKLEAEVAKLTPVLVDKLKAEIPGILQQAQSQVVTKLWPALQPKVRAELDYGIDQGKRIAWMVGGAVALSVVLSAMWTRKKAKATS